MSKPRIGITSCSKNADYVESVRRAGAEPVLLDWKDLRSATDALATIDGVLMTGGPDVDPAEYGEARDPSVVSIADPVRDRFEVELARAAVRQDKPVLAICRGMQVLNVALGGTLIQDIPSQLPKALTHQMSEPKNAIAHVVTLVPGSKVEALLRSTEVRVNSRHHQAVKTLGSGLVVTATAPDNVVEAVEQPNARFCVGVEWHPENFVDTGEFLPLFDGLVAAATPRP